MTKFLNHKVSRIVNYLNHYNSGWRRQLYRVYNGNRFFFPMLNYVTSFKTTFPDDTDIKTRENTNFINFRRRHYLLMDMQLRMKIHDDIKEIPPSSFRIRPIVDTPKHETVQQFLNRLAISEKIHSPQVIRIINSYLPVVF